MKLRRFFCLLMAAALVLSLVSCSKGGFDEKLGEVVNGGNDDPGDGGSGDQDGGSEDGGGDSDGFVLDYAKYSDGLDERGFFQGVTARDIVTLPDYKSAVMPTEADEDEVRELIISALQSNADPTQVTDRPVEDGDTLNIDYVGSLDGVEFDGGSTKGAGTTVTIGVTSYIDDFLEQLIGHTPGENFDIEVTFPDPYQNNPDLAGKDAIFNITINYICEWEINDQSHTVLGFDTAEDMWEAARQEIIDEQTSEALEELLSQASCENIPQSVLDTVHNMNLLYYAQLVQSYYGVSLDVYLSYMGYSSVDEFGEGLAEDDRIMAVRLLAAQAIAEIEGIEVTVEDIAEGGYESSVDAYGEPYVRLSILNYEKLTEFLAGNQD